ncbi:MAG: ribose-5-phosphate isomerase RpiA [Chloroflexi bacterium]|nr:ribose-5-phosphate isomerase RpiA [Chloroflexota bacterium]
MNIDDLKRQAAERAVEFIKSGMVVGLGTGSTAVHAVCAIGRKLQDGSLTDIVAIPTSEATAREAEKWQIPLTTLSNHPVVDLTIDGADEIAPNLDLIKGLGGALLREKIVAAVTKQFIIVADGSKIVTQLGTRAPIPVEVIPFAQQPVAAFLTSLGSQVVLRVKENQTFITDEGNVILDCHFDGIENAKSLGQMIRSQPGVVEHGLFLSMAERAIVAAANGIAILT